ncbi:hypothetical protein C10C_1033 [Chlamydia serpentis]|uniref:Uncharacterized protein n=1 Tax=Chlamydia serpentis TaxID=1967782 RepID=A0A2R8FCM5_9CHLA|nr:hypothetical protein [Chlamydia serpentis]SPN74164.1 hypothetical protein C10C_1033 [Chlamydia serpentis]
MVEANHDNPLLKELFALQQSLENLTSLGDVLSTYETMFLLIHAGLHRALKKNQQSYLLSIDSKGDLRKSPSGDPILQTFSIHPHN